MRFSKSSSPPAYEPPNETRDLERPAAQTPTEGELHQQLPLGSDVQKRDPYAAWRFRDYKLWAIGGFLSGMGGQLQGVTIGYDLAQRFPDAKTASWVLGLVSLVQGLPVLLFALPAGQMADHFNRRRLILCGLLASAIGSLALAFLSATKAPLPTFYVCLFLLGVARALAQPAHGAFLNQLVPSEVLPNAVTWNSTRWQIASVLGPALFGPALYFLGAAWGVYLLEAGALLIFFGMLLNIRGRPQERSGESISVASLLAGARFVWRSDLILATLTLDLFVVLLGGAVVLLPIYAEHILRVDATGLGWLRAAPAVGALLTALTLAYLPPMRRAGKTLLWAVAGFAGATILFGVSKVFWLSLLALFLTGAFDMVSVVVRHTLVQLVTPNHMMGRVSAVNGVFIGASNEMGGFESGLVARFFGPVVSVVSGGIGSLFIVAATAWKWPRLWHLGRLEDLKPED